MVLPNQAYHGPFNIFVYTQAEEIFVSGEWVDADYVNTWSIGN